MAALAPKVLQMTLQNFLRQEVGVLSKSPILLLTSEPPESVKSATSNASTSNASTSSSSRMIGQRIDQSIQRFQFHAQNEFGLALFQSKTPSAICTKNDVANAVALKQRMGASIVIGMGSGAVMDLAKATAQASAFASSSSSDQQQQQDNTEYDTDTDTALYLIPSTSAALLASQSNATLLLDTTEETIIVSDYGNPQPQYSSSTSSSTTSTSNTSITATTTTSSSKQQNNNGKVVVVVNDPDIIIHPHTISACQSILLDAALRGDQTVDVASLLLGGHTNSNNNNNNQILSLVQQAAHRLSTGLTADHTRSIPLALSSSLIPPVFSSTHIFSFWASLVPALAAQLHDSMEVSSPSIIGDYSSIDGLYPSLASMALEAQSVEALLQHVRNNQTASQQHAYDDVKQDVLADILAMSLNR